MTFKQFIPSIDLCDFIESYWVVRQESNEPITQKIIPDGYPELIFHFKDRYQIKLFDKWEDQDFQLFSGQITRFFYLRNTGPIGILGVKLKPTTPAHWLGVDMKKYTDVVVPWQQLGKPLLEHKEIDFLGDIKKQLDDLFERQMKAIINADRPIVEQACDHIIKSQGGLTVSDLAESVGLGERQLERLFSKYVGLSPKRYIRLIRFNHIFKLMQAEDVSWCQLAIDSGYYDQSHFIKEFKQFSGEHPSKYGFDDDTFANFFLRPR